jgi:fatty-acyl-CoA synthase
MNFCAVLEHHAERFSDRSAIEYQGTSVSYADLFRRVQRTAGALDAAGVRQGDVVAILLYNCTEFIEAMFGTAYLGAIFMPLNWRLAGPELAYILNHAGARVLITEAELQQRIDEIRDTLDCQTLITIRSTADSKWLSLDDLSSGANPVTSSVELSEDAVHRLMYTSGTTSRPKGVAITYGNLYWKNISHIIELEITQGDRGLAAGPLYHVGALDLTTTTMLHVGATTCILRKFDSRDVLDAIEGNSITNLWLAPAMLNLVLADPSLQDRDLSSVRLLIDGGEKMPRPLIERVVGAFPNAWFADAYGLTETVSGDTFLNKTLSRSKIGSVGKPVIHVEIRVVDAQDLPVAAGEAGEVVIRGPKVFKGYWRDEEASAKALRGGWFHTGDIGVLDIDGFLYIVDRLKDMIISGGENVASLEVERVLYEHPAVVEAAVVGRPDVRWGEIPVGYVVLSQASAVTEPELIEFCRARLASFKSPKQIRFIDALPRNPSGKVLKRELREREARTEDSSGDQR